MNKNWTKEGYKLYAMKDGFIMDFSMGSSESIENEIIAKGTRHYDFWLVEKDGKIDFYSVKIDPKAQGLGIEIKKEKTISGTIVEDKRSNYQGFGAIGGGIVVDFMNYKIIEKTPNTNKKEISSMFYITYSDVRSGDCIVSYENKPTWDLDSAMTFENESEANDWIQSSQAKEWVNVGYNGKFTICEVNCEE